MHGDGTFLLHAAWGEQISVGALAVAEVARFDPAAFGQGFEAIVDFVQVHVQLAGEVVLGELAARVEWPQKAVLGIGHVRCARRSHARAGGT